MTKYYVTALCKGWGARGAYSIGYYSGTVEKVIEAVEASFRGRETINEDEGIEIVAMEEGVVTAFGPTDVVFIHDKEEKEVVAIKTCLGWQLATTP